MTSLSDTLTSIQQQQLIQGELHIEVDHHPTYPGCYRVQDDQGRQGTGRSARLAIESLERDQPE